MRVERRWFSRVNMNFDCTVYSDNLEYAGKVLNISEEGVCLEINSLVDFEVNDVVKFQGKEKIGLKSIVYIGVCLVVRVEHRANSTIIGCRVVEGKSDSYLDLVKESKIQQLLAQFRKDRL